MKSTNTPASSLRKPAICGVILLILMAVMVSPALAQNQPPVAIELPAQPLDRSLVDLAEQTGVTIIAPNALVAGKSAPAVSGMLAPEEAVRRLLVDSGLTAQIGENGAIIVRAVTATSPNSEPLQLNAITVQGQLVERSLQDTHASVAVISGDTLDRSSDRDINDVLENVANVGFVNQFGITMRGVPFGSATGAGTGSTINISIDGASLESNRSFNGGALSAWDLEQVEVLRGPQSTQQGRNALAGAIYVRSKDPSFDQELKTRVDVGDFNEHRFALAFNQPLIDDILAFRFSAEKFGSDGYITNTFDNSDDFAEFDRETLRGKLRYRPTDELDIVLGYTYADSLDNVQEASPPDATDFKVFKDVAESRRGKTNSANLRIDYDLNGHWSLLSETTYLDYELRAVSDSAPAVNPNLNFVQEHYDETFTQELRFQYQRDVLAGTVGLYYADISIEDPGAGRGDGGGGSELVFDLINNADVENYALFGELDYRFADWTFTVGGRYDYEKRSDFVSRLIVFDPPLFPFPNDPASDTDTSYSAFLPKLGLIYHWNDDVSTGLTVQRGYRSGGSGASTFETYEFDEETTTNYELSLRSVWMDDRLVVNANVFFTDWKDQQVFVDRPFVVGPTDRVIENAGESELYGFELETQFSPNDNLDLFLNLGYTKTKFKDFVSNGVDLAGNEFFRSPRWTGSLGGTYYFDNGFVAEASGSYTDGTFEDVENTPSNKSDSRFLVDARLGYEWDDWSVFLYARNLFDESYVERDRFDPSNDIVGEPRVIGLQLNAAFL